MPQGRAHARTSRRPAQPVPRRPQVLPGGGRGIRWDRLGRGMLLLGIVGILALYVGPTISLVETWRERGTRAAEVQALQGERAKLRERRAQLRDPVVLEREARRLGMVKPGERAYVLRGLPE